MIITNKSKRTIDGILPGQTVDAPEAKAKMYLSMYASEIVELVVDSLTEEASNVASTVANNPDEDIAREEEEEEEEESIVDIRKAFVEKFKKPVPANMKNNNEWIKSKLSE